MAGTTGQTTGERARVSRHFLRVEAALAERSVRRLEPVRRLTRRLLLAELAEYRRARRFPLNRDFRGKQVPYFIDEAGTRCAVAHLLEVGGQAELVQKIARERNHARVAELANERWLVRWLAAAGLTLEEAALIQPTYCTSNGSPTATVGPVCCNEMGADTLVEATVAPATSFSGLTATVTAIYGKPHDDLAVGDAVNIVDGQTLYENTALASGDTVLLKVAYSVNEYNVVEKHFSLAQAYAADATTLSCERHSADRAAFIRALSSPDCAAQLTALGREWSASPYPAGSAGPCDSDEVVSCELGHLGAAPGPLLASFGLLGVLLAYRRRRRAR